MAFTSCASAREKGAIHEEATGEICAPGLPATAIVGCVPHCLRFFQSAALRFFAPMMGLQFFVVWFIYPETSNVSLEKMNYHQPRVDLFWRPSACERTLWIDGSCLKFCSELA